jgi:hypothetical protein
MMSVQLSLSPVPLARGRVPDSAGEGPLTRTLALESMAKGPHAAMLARLQRKLASGGHLLPPAAGEGQLGKWGSIQ